MVGYPHLKGCAERRPTRESPLDCNVSPRNDKHCEIWTEENNRLDLFSSSIFYLVRFRCDLLLKPLEHFTVFSLVHCHLVQVALCQG